MVQDLSFEHRPLDYPPVTRARLQQVVRRQVRSARVVLTVSGHARGDLVDTYGLDPERVFHVPNAALPPAPLDDAALERQRAWLRDQGVTGPYLLYLGNLHPRKNVTRAIEAFAEGRRTRPELAGVQFVVAGARWWGGGEQEAAEAAGDGAVVFLGRVDEAQREVLLRDATALVYLSLFEGFGLPPLEAMSRGTPVVASDRTSVPEVVGDGGLLVDPLDVPAVTDAMARIVGDGALRDRLVEAGLARAAAYTVRSTGKALRAAFEAALVLGPGPTVLRPPALAAAGEAAAAAEQLAVAAADWEGNARSDAGFAVLSERRPPAGPTEGQLGDVLASGELELARLFERLEEHGLQLPRWGSALDFGCGVGRLTVPLARRFDEVVGVDVSPTMVAHARANAPESAAGRLSFVVNDAPDLGRFAEGSFDFVLSDLVLQHLGGALQRRYVAEFCRVLRPGGLAVFQLPSRRRGTRGAVRRWAPHAVTALARRVSPPTAERPGGTLRIEVNCLPETEVWRTVEHGDAVVVHTTYTNGAERDYGGRVEFRNRDEAWARAAGGGYLSPLYVVRRSFV
jgi:SAM-dependent methyltransferase